MVKTVEKRELEYHWEGDQLYPNITVPEKDPEILRLAGGKYASLRQTYLKNYHKGYYIQLKTTCTLSEHLAEIELAAEQRLEYMTKRMAAQEGITEQLKADDPMKWVQGMNSIRNRIDETIYHDLIYS
jgi:hypothetical protein